MEFFYKMMNRSKSMSPITQNNAPQQQTKMNSHSNPGTPTQGFVKPKPNTCDPLVSVAVNFGAHSPWYCFINRQLVGDGDGDLWIITRHYIDQQNYSFFSAVIIVWTLGKRPSSADCKKCSTTTKKNRIVTIVVFISSRWFVGWVTQNLIIIQYANNILHNLIQFSWSTLMR